MGGDVHFRDPRELLDVLWASPQCWPDIKIIQEITEGFCFAAANVKLPAPPGIWRHFSSDEGQRVPMRWDQTVVQRVCPPCPPLCWAGTEAQAGQNVLGPWYILYLSYFLRKIENIPSNIYNSSTVDWCGDFGRQGSKQWRFSVYSSFMF